MENIMSEIKKGEISRVTFTNEQLHRYFPQEYTAEKIIDIRIDRLSDNVYHYDAKERIFELAEKYERRMEDKSRDKIQTKNKDRRSVLSELGNKQKECSGFEKKPGRTTKKKEMEI